VTSASVAPHVSVNHRVAGGTSTNPTTSTMIRPASTMPTHLTMVMMTEPMISPSTRDTNTLTV